MDRPGGRRLSPQRLPPSLQMPFITGRQDKCECEACKRRESARWDPCQPYSNNRAARNYASPMNAKGNYESSMNPAIANNRIGKRAEGNNESYRNPTTGISANGNCAAGNNELGNYDLEKQAAPINSTNGSQNTITGFSSNVMDYITEVVLVLVIILVATIAVWITFFQLIHSLFNKIQQSNNRRLQVAALTFIGILLFAILCSAIQDQYTRHKARKAKVQKHVPSKYQNTKKMSHKTCAGQTSHMLWSSSKHESSHKSYLPWKSECPRKKAARKKCSAARKSADKSSIIFWTSGRSKTSFSDKLHNFIFFWRSKRKHGKRWVEVFVWNPAGIKRKGKQLNKKLKNKWNEMHHDVHVWLASVRRKHDSYQKKIYHWLQDKKYNTQKRVHRMRKKMRRWFRPKTHKAKCACKKKFYFWRFLCPRHKLQKEQKSCYLCSLRFKSPGDRKKAKKQRRAYKRAKVYSMPAEMKTPPMLLTFFRDQFMMQQG